VVETETNVVEVAVEGVVAAGSKPIEAVEASTSDAVLPLLSVAFPSVSNKVFGARALLDTGALGANLITPSLAQTLVQLALAETVEEDIIVCPAFGPCKTFKQKLKFTYGFVSERRSSITNRM
jgi:hypothetical protein